MTEVLKPCPFCGSTDIESRNGYDCWYWTVACQACDGAIEAVDDPDDGGSGRDLKAEAEAKWNRRHT